jgi:pentatricopeptide repeat protein
MYTHSTDIMAAGKALARAGLWKDCLLLTTDKESIAKYGPSIATASMLACIEAKRYTDAIAAYDLFMSGNQSTASEYQWGGGTVTVVKPLCRDLLLSSMGHVKKGGFSQDAMAVFKEIIEDGSSMSKAALLGLAHSLENDGDWQSSIKLLRGYIDLVYRKRNPSWRIVPDALDVNRDDDDNTLSPHDQNNLLTDILASVMRVCNREGQYGLALILCSIVDRSYASGLNLNGDLKIHDCSSTVRSILSQRVVSENQQVLEVYLKSLYWLGCGSTVNELVNAAQSRYNNIEASTPWGLRHNDLPHGESWINATIASGRVLEAMSAINRERQSLSEESRMLFERGLARAMGHCIDSDQPSAALYLFEHASVILSASEEEDPTLAGRVRTFFGFEDSYGDNTGGGLFQTHTTVDLKDLHLSDSFIGAVIKSYCKLGQYDKACAALDDGLISSGQQSLLMSQSNNNTLEALLHVDIDKCMSFLDSMDVRLVNPTTFSMIARHFAKNEMWPEIGEVYNRAKRAGCISEDLGLIAMQAVAEAELLDGKIVVLRGVVKDIVAVVGIKSDEFIKSRYWSIKRSVGFHYARVSLSLLYLIAILFVWYIYETFSTLDSPTLIFHYSSY